MDGGVTSHSIKNELRFGEVDPVVIARAAPQLPHAEVEVVHSRRAKTCGRRWISSGAIPKETEKGEQRHRV